MHSVWFGTNEVVLEVVIRVEKDANMDITDTMTDCGEETTHVDIPVIDTPPCITENNMKCWVFR